MTRAFRAILRTLVLRPLRRERGRSLLSVAGVAVGVAVLVAIQLANQSALRAFGESVDAVAGRANWQITSDAGQLDETLLLTLQPLWDEGVRFAPVIDIDALLLPAEIPVRMLAVDLMSDLHFRDYQYARVDTERRAGGADLAAFLSLFDERSAVVPATFARQHGLSIGSPVRLETQGVESDLIVRGILEPRGPATAFNGSLVVVDLAVAQEAFPPLQGTLTRIDLMVPEESEAETIEWIRAQLPPDARVESPGQRGERVDRMLRAFRVNLFALASVSLLVGFFLVYNTVLISILRRRRDIGIIKTLGGTARGIFSAFLIEGALFGIAGGAAGVLLGWSLAVATLGLISRTVNALYVQSAPSDVTMTPFIALSGVFLGLLVSVGAAIQPSIEAARVRPGMMIRAGLYQRPGRRAQRQMLLGAVVSFILALLLARVPAIGRLPVGGYASVVAIIAGFSLLAPAALERGADLLRPILARTMGITGRLAASGVTSSLRRTAVATAALTVAIGMMVAVTVMVGSFRRTVEVWVDQTVRSDLWLRPAQGLQNAPNATFPPSILTALERIGSVAAIDAVRARPLVYRDDTILLGAADFDVARDRGDLPMVRGSAGEAIDRALASDGVLISETLAIHHAMGAGDSIELPVPGGVRAFPVTGVYRDYSSDRGVVFMDRALYRSLWNDDAINTIAVYLKDRVEPEAARRELETGLGSEYRFFVATNALIRREVMRIFDQTFLITWSLLIVSLVVAVLGIVNTLSALILERRREIQLLRTLGTSSAQVRAMIVGEAGIIGLVASVLGTANGLLLSTILIFVINRQSFGWTIMFSPPWRILGISLAVIFVATLLSGLVPARVAQRRR